MFKVKQFFTIDNVHKKDKVKIVSIHLHDRALIWNLQFVKIHEDKVTWNVYEEAIVKRFGPLNKDPMAQLKHLRPKSLVDAFSLANLKKATLVVVVKHKNTPILQTPKANNGFYANRNVVRQLSQKEIAKKRAKNLCFYCDQKYMPSHKCSCQMYALEISPREGDYELDLSESQEEDSANKGQELFESECYSEISLNALTGVPTFNTMRVRGNVGKHLLHMLYDTSSTHNFLDLFTTKKLGCNLRKTCPLQVTVAGRSKLVSQNMVYGFQLTI
nr:hypothetical protein [Tanacetum cinerariifolium]